MLIAALVLCSAVYAQPPRVQSRLESVAEEFIRIYNTGDTLQYESLIKSVEQDPAKQKDMLFRYRNTWDFIGPVEVRKMVPVEDKKVEVWVQEKKYESWWKFDVFTDSIQRFKGRTVLPVGFTEAFISKGKLSHRENAETLDEYIVKKLGDNFKGNVLIEHNGKAFYSRSFGDNPKGQPNTLSEMVGLASMGKMFTAISILQLMDEKKLSLDDEVAKHFPEIKRKDISEITLRQLLTHTSGMGDFFSSPVYEKLKDSIRKPIDMLPVIEADPLLFDPGTKWAYSNSGFALLGILIERITGQSYQDYVRSHIFLPAGMSTVKAGDGAGGGEATVADLQAFSKAIRDSKLLDASTTREWFSYTVNNGKYGYGSEHQKLGKDYVFGHSGGFINTCTELNIYLHSGYTVIILSNSNPPYGHFLSNKIKELLVRN